MPTPPWANDAQLNFLKDQIVAFHSCQQSRTLLQSFWPQTIRDFFEKWPDANSEKVGLMEKEKKNLRTNHEFIKDMTDEQWVRHRKNAIHNWYYNHNLNKKKRGGKSNSVKITLPQSASRLSTKAHLYSKRYYETKVKHFVEAEIGDEKINPQDRIAIVNKHLNRCYNSESAEIKEEIRKLREEERAAKQLAQSQDIAVAQAKAFEELSIEELIVAQGCVPELLADFAEEISQCVGWSWAMIGGGPDAANNGEITTISLHTGQDKYGHTFRRAYKDYVEAVEIPFSKHLDAVYPKAICDKFMARALTLGVAGPSGHSTDTLEDSSPSSTLTPAPEAEPKSLANPTTSTAPNATAAPNAVIAPTAALDTAISMDIETATITPLDTSAAIPLGPHSVPGVTIAAVASSHDLLNAVDVNLTTVSLLGSPNVPNPDAAATPLLVPQISNDIVPPNSVNTDAVPMPSASNFNPTVLNDHSALHNIPPTIPTPSALCNLPGVTGYANTLQNNKENYPMTHLPIDNTKAAPPVGLNFPNNTAFNAYYGNDFTYQTNTMGYQGYNGNTHFDPAAGLSNMGTVDWDAFDTFLNSWSSNMSANIGQQSFENNSQGAGGVPMTPLARGPEAGGPIDANITPSQTGPSNAAVVQTDVPKSIAPSQESNPVETAPSSALAVEKAPPVEGGVSLEVQSSTVDAPRGSQPRKGPISREVVPLTEKQAKSSDWIATACDYLKTGVESSQWQELVEVWVKFETESGLREGPSQRLLPKDRPAILSKWLSNRRQFDNVPKVDDVASFGVEWLTWWNGMQPKWRKSSTPGSLPQPISIAKNKEDLLSIKKAGPVGLVVAIIALKWWAGDGGSVAWLNAVDDMKAALESMLAAMPNLKWKMDSGSTENVSSDKRRKM